MKPFRKSLAVLLSALSLSVWGGCHTPSYDGFVFPPESSSTLTPVTDAPDSNFIERHFDGVAPTKEATLKTLTSQNGLCTIEKKKTYYDVTLDYERGNYHDVGAAYGEVILQMIPDYPQLIEGYLMELLKDFGTGPYDEMMARVRMLKSSLRENYRQELEGFAETVSNGQHNIINDGQLSYEEAVLLSMVSDAVRGTCCSVITANSHKTDTGHRLAARLLDWEPGKDRQISLAHCVTHFKNGDKSFTNVGVLGIFDILTGVNCHGLMIGELDVGSSFDVPFSSEGKVCYTYDLRYILENYSSVSSAAQYIADRCQSYTYNVNIFIANDRDAVCVETVVDEMEGHTTIRNGHTDLNEGVTWSDPDWLCIVNSYVAKGNADKLTTEPGNGDRWRKYDKLFCSEQEPMTLSHFKELLTCEKVKDTNVYNFHNEINVHMVVADFSTGSLQAVFLGKEITDDVEWIDLGKAF